MRGALVPSGSPGSRFHGRLSNAGAVTGFLVVAKEQTVTKVLVIFAALLTMGASLFAQAQACQWTLGLNGQLCGFRPFSANSLWNTRADSVPTDRKSADILKSIGKARLFVDPEVPYIVVDSTSQPMVPVLLTAPVTPQASGFCQGRVCQAPFPLNVAWTQKGQNPGAADYHGIVIDRARGVSWEAEGLNFVNGQWQAQVVSRWDLYGGDKQGPWLVPSANAAGTSWMASLLTYDEAAADQVNHALGFTLSPRHFPNLMDVWFTPPATMPITSNGTSDRRAVGMGTRFVLRADFDESGYPPIARSIIHALKNYGMILMDRGGDMYIAATGDPRWPSDQLRTLWKIMPTDFRVVKTQPRYGYHAYPRQ